MEYLCVVESFFEDSPSGSARVAWDIAKAMRDQGYSVTLLCYQSGDKPLGIAEHDGVRLVRFQKAVLPSWHPGRLQAILDSTAAACGQWLGDRQWDVVHVHTALIGLGVVAGLGKAPKYVFTVHSPLVLEQEIHWRHQGLAGRLKLLFGRAALARAERQMLQAASEIHTLSEFTRQKIDASYGVGKRVTVIPHWYEHSTATPDKVSARAALGWPAEATIFFTVRGLSPRYGVDVAIRALAPLVQKQDCHFYVGGSGPLRQTLEALATELDAAGHIHFLGRLSDADLELAYAAADVFILPTLALECFGLITIEALSLGCPVIASDVAAIPEMMQPILPECVVPAGDVAALREKARQVMAHEINLPDRNSLIEYARLHYSRAVIVPRFVALFEQAVQRARVGT